MKYGPEKTKEICDLLRAGSNRTDACSCADVSYETFTVWMQKAEFSERIKKAEAECKNRNIKIIQKAAITTWQAGAWWLERKHSDEFALKNKTEMQLTFQKSERMKPIDNEKLIEVVTIDEIENHAK
jgi:hypothetical protein